MPQRPVTEQLRLVVAHDLIFSGPRLKEIRTMRRYSYGMLSMQLFRYHRTKVSYEALRRYELGKRDPTFNLVVKLAAALHCEVARLCVPERTRGVTIESKARPLR